MAESPHEPAAAPRLTADFPALQRIGWPWPGASPQADWQALQLAHPKAVPMRVIAQHRTRYDVAASPEQSLRVDSPPEWQRRRGDPNLRAAVGDWVLVEADASQPMIVALLPRWSLIKRAAAGEHYRQQPIAANVDTAFVVSGLDADFNPRRIERYLLLLQGSGVTPVVVLTKSDLHDEARDAVAMLLTLAGEGVAVRSVNAKDPESVASLGEWLGAGRTVVLLGSSGAGKSTLTNTLLGEQRMKTGAVRESDARGRHTTTHRALLALPQGACIIDTPGMRELKPTGEEKIEESFADIEALADACRFRDCKHDREPGCAVREAIQKGALDEARVANWRKLSGEVEAAADVLATRIAQKGDAKVLTRALHKRLDDKYGRH